MKRLFTAMVLGMALVIASNASASTMDFLGEGKVAIVSIRSPSLGMLQTYAGELNWKWIGGTPAGYAPSFYTYCIDANNYVTDPQNSVTIRSTTELSNPGVTNAGGKAAWLFDTYAQTIHDTGTGDDAAALQVAIWAALYNPTNSLTTGPFALTSASTSIVTKAQNYMTALYSGPGGYNSAVASWLDSPAGSGQDQIVMNPVPEPASLLLCAAGLAGLFFRRRQALQA